MEKKEKKKYNKMNKQDKIKLIIWLGANREICEQEVARVVRDKFVVETGINAEVNSVSYQIKEVFPDLVLKRPTSVACGKSNWGTILSRINALEVKVAQMDEIIVKKTWL